MWQRHRPGLSGHHHPGQPDDRLYDGLQALLLGVMTPEEFTAELQREWQIAKDEGTILRPGGLSVAANNRWNRSGRPSPGTALPL